MKQIIAIFDVDESSLNEISSTFEEEVSELELKGICLQDYMEAQNDHYASCEDLVMN